jgi:hypothetical protein
MSKAIHLNVLLPSRLGNVALCQAVEERFKNLIDSWANAKGEMLEIPEYLNKDMHLWRTLAVRYKSGDLRHTVDEYKACKRIAEWTHKYNCELRNQPHTPIEWPD